MMSHVSMTTGMAVESITSGRNGRWNDAKRCASPITIGKSAAQVMIAIFHCAGGLDGAGIPPTVSPVTSQMEWADGTSGQFVPNDSDCMQNQKPH